MLRRQIFFLLLVVSLVFSLVPAQVTAAVEMELHRGVKDAGCVGSWSTVQEGGIFFELWVRLWDVIHLFHNGNPMFWSMLMLLGGLHGFCDDEHGAFRNDDSGLPEASTPAGSSGSGGSGKGGTQRDDRDDSDDDSTPAVPDFQVVPNYAEILVGETVTFQANMKGRDRWPVAYPLTWSASGGRIDQQGRFTADVPGTYTVTATSLGKSATAQVVVTSPVANIRVQPEEAEILVGETVHFRVELTGTDGEPLTDIPVTWSASGGRIDQQGMFTADEPGTYTVTAVALGKWAAVQVTVKALPEIESIYVTPTQTVLLLGNSITFQAVLMGTDGKQITDIPVAWSASGGHIDEQGTFTADEPGTYTITATALGKSAAAQVTVIRYQPAPRPPELKLKPLPDRQDDEGDPVSFTVELTNPAVQNVEFSMSGAPKGVQIDPNTGEVSGTISYDNVDEENEPMSEFHVVVTARETGGLKRVVTEEFTWRIGPEFKLQPLLDLQNGEGDSISFTVKLTNSAITPNVQFSMSGAPNGVQIDPNTGQVSGTIAPDNVDEENEPMSEFHVVVTARETGGLKRVVTEEFTWRIGPEFKLKALPDRYNNEGDSVSFTVELTNPNVKFVEFSLLRAPEGVQIDPDTGEVSWTIGYDTVPDPNLRLIEFNVVVRATETEGLKRVSEEKFHWVIYDKSQS